MGTNISVRPWCKKDISSVYEIEKESFRTPWSRISFLQEYANPLAHYYVICLDDKVIGFGGSWVMYDEAHVTNIAIKIGYRSNGYSKILLLEMMKNLLKYDVRQMTLEVRENNYIAQNLYKQFDFSEEGRRPKYYEDTGEAAILMWNHNISETTDKFTA